MAFGNAEHGTTRGCLRLLDQALRPGERVLDVGTGSGVLSIAAALLGAREVVALEGDVIACEVALENLARNGVSNRVSVRETWADADELARMGPFDGVTANIEASTLRALLPGLRGCLAQHGWIILSGLLASETSDLQDAARALGLSPVATDEDGEWRSLLLRAPG
jgi:ribosomal protein L11 methyltransferase